jgi:FkbM family methyltransferase
VKMSSSAPQDAKISNSSAVSLARHLGDDESPFGTYAPTPLQSVLLQIGIVTPLGRGKARDLLCRLMGAIRPGPLDVQRLGLAMRLYHNRHHGDRKMLMRPAAYECPEIDFLADDAPENFHFVDIGANAGLYSLAIACRLPQARILALEPNPIVYRRLAFNLRSNRLDDVCALELAAGESENMLDMGLYEESLLKTLGGQPIVSVRVRPLLDVLAEHGFARIDALKIDVEGFEDQILEPFFRNSAKSLLPGRLIIEHLFSKQWRCDLIAQAKALGYIEQGRTPLNLLLKRATN